MSYSLQQQQVLSRVQETEVGFLEAISESIRRRVLTSIYETKSPHIGSSFSAVEILVALFFKALNISPQTTDDPNRDRFILSKGHACPALYAVLTERGYFTEDELRGFAINGGKLEQHPNIDLPRGVELSSGSLGHGLPIGAGMALAGRIDERGYRVCVLLSDGELNEGSVWEAVMFAGHHRLANLIALVDANGMQALGYTKDVINLEPIGNKWGEFGWHAQVIDGHSVAEILEALESLSADKPNVIVLNTVKGKGVSFMENNLLWHYRAPDDEEYRLALEELS